MTPEQNKAIVKRFNAECIEQGNTKSFNELLAEDCVNHTAVTGSPNDAASMVHFLRDILRPAFPDLKVTILDQIAEDDKVMTRKEIHGTQKGLFMGVPPTNKKVVIKVIDIIRLRNGQYTDHWASHNIPEVLAELTAK